MPGRGGLTGALAADQRPPHAAAAPGKGKGKDGPGVLLAPGARAGLPVEQAGGLGDDHAGGDRLPGVGGQR
jgi:hypothetical protein